MTCNHPNAATCGCCEGTQILTPMTTANRPGLTALSYRVGIHATFLETMKARLSNLQLPDGSYPLQKLTTRSEDDPAIALLDAWATVADVLTFYQERIANEGYLPTATERRSIVELANLIGYKLRPGVAASTFLAFTLEAGHEVEIPAGTRAQSLPGPGELPQPFETSDPLLARAEWNALKPRTTRAQFLSVSSSQIHLQGLQTTLKPNDPLLVLSIERERLTPHFRRILTVETDATADHTTLTLRGSLKLDELLAHMAEASDLPVAVRDPQIVLPNELEPQPVHNASDVPLADEDGDPQPVILSWNGIARANAAGDVYYSLEMGVGRKNAPANEFDKDLLVHIANLRVTPTDNGGRVEYSLAPTQEWLLGGVAYYWRVTATDDLSTTVGPLWRFTTDGTSPAQLPELSSLVHTPTPADETSDVALTDDSGNPIALTWAALDPNTAIGEVTYIVALAVAAKDADDHAFDPNSLVNMGLLVSPPSTGGLVSFQPPPLVEGVTYYWRVMAVDDRRTIVGPIWKFSTLGAAPANLPEPPLPLEHPHVYDGVSYHQLPANNLVLRSSIVLWWRSTDPYSSRYQTVHTIAIGTDPTDLRPVANIKQQQIPSFTWLAHSFDTTESTWLAAGTRYYWQVIVTGELGRYYGPIWQFTTDGTPPPIVSLPNSQNLPLLVARTTLDDQHRLAAQRELIENVTRRIGTHSDSLLASETLINRLRNQNLSPNTLEAYIELEKAGLDNLTKETGDATVTAGIIDIFDELTYPTSNHDYSKIVAWVAALKNELDSMIAQLPLLPEPRLMTGRVLPGKQIRPEAVIQLRQKTQLLPGYVKNNPIEARTGKLDMPDEIGDLSDTLADPNQSEDDKVISVERWIRRIEDLGAVFAAFREESDTPPELTQLLDWLTSIRTTLINIVQNIDVADEASTTLTFPDLDRLQQPPAVQPDNSLKLERDLSNVFAQQSDFTARLITVFQPELQGNLYQAWANSTVSGLASLQGVDVLRVKAVPYGSQLPLTPNYDERGNITSRSDWKLGAIIAPFRRDVLTLDTEYSQIMAGSWVVVEWADERQRERFEGRVEKAETVTKAGYGKVTQLILDRDWLGAADTPESDLSVLRTATIFTHSESLPLARSPETEDVRGKEIDLDGLYDGLTAGRWLVVAGERTDIPGTSGVHASELVMLADVKQVVQQVQLQIEEESTTVDFDAPHTKMVLAENGLAYTYKRDSVKIYGNVVKATHGETREEVLGSGDGRKTRQPFTLKQKPLTHVAAPTPSGIQSTLDVRVNNVRWHEEDNLIWLDANDRGFITQTDNEDKTTIIFGDGKNGARLPTGIENIKAVYRNGIGKAGNVAAEQITLLAAKPLGVKAVINPLRASGGANRERRDQARRNAPLAVSALDRLVSLQDYADFTRTYAGIGKASAVRLIDGRRQLLYVTIAGADDIPIDESSDLFQSLCQALHKFGELHLPIVVAVRELVLLIISANIRLLADYLWESIAPQIRTALLDEFSFERCDLGQDVLLSQVISTIQRVPGVAYVDVDVLDGVGEETPRHELESLAPHLKRHDRIPIHSARVQTHHVVQRENETFASVAARYEQVSEEQLREWNPTVPEYLAAGTVVFLNENKSEQIILLHKATFEEIAREHSLVEEGLRQWNPQAASALTLGEGTQLSLNTRRIRPAQIAYLSPDLPDLLILKEVTA